MQTAFPHQMTRCRRYISRHDDIIDEGDLASKVRREQERQVLADGSFVAPFLVAKKVRALWLRA
jgi:hypothetical protein